jgi:Zn-dependent protease with chaperone function
MYNKKIFFRSIFFLALFATLSLIGWWVYDRYFAHTLYVDSEHHCRIDIRPSFNYQNAEVTKAIEIVKQNSPEYYEKLCSYVAIIDSTNSCDSRSTACAYGGNKIGINKNNYVNTEKLAGVLVHETCHFHQGHTATPESYINFDLDSNESECYSEEDKFLNIIDE